MNDFYVQNVVSRCSLFIKDYSSYAIMLNNGNILAVRTLCNESPEETPARDLYKQTVQLSGDRGPEYLEMQKENCLKLVKEEWVRPREHAE